MRVFVTRPLPGRALERLQGVCDIDVWPEGGPPATTELRDRARNAEGILCLLTDQIDAHLLDACPRLRVVSNMAVGVDNIDVAAAGERGIAVGNTPDVLTDATADLTLALILAAARRLPEGIAAVRDGTWGPWSPDWLLGLELREAQLTIIGPGRIGTAVTKRAQAFGMQVTQVGRSGKDELRALIGSAHVVSLHCPLAPDTYHLVDDGVLDAMRPSAILVNTARGGIVDQDALARALCEGHIGAAALDVTDPEPLPPSHPLLASPNLIVLPHLGSATRSTRERMADLAVANVIAGLAGEPLPHAVAVASPSEHSPKETNA